MLLYAGLDKLLDPAFLQSTGPGSIGQQLEGFTHASPLTPLIQVFALPMPILVGLLIALAEIAIGLGALTGLLYRAAAVGGVALSLLFWLTASWTTRPIYYGPDLPYAIGWLTLALAGSGELYTLRSWFDGLVDTEAVPGYEDYSSERRVVLQAVALGAVAVAVGGVGGVAGRILHGGDDTTAGSGLASLPGTDSSGLTASPGAVTASPAPSAADGGGTTAGAGSAGGAGGAAGGTTGSSSGTAIATLSQVKKGQAYEFSDPATGDPAVLIRLANDHLVAYDAVCTHQGCTVGYDSASGLLFCPCHGAVFDPTHGAEVVAGPAPTPLTSLPLNIDSATGKITVRA